MQVALQVRHVFAEILGVEASGVPLGDDFFAHGGDSFRAGRVIAALRRDFSVDLQISALYQHKTASAMAAFLRTRLPHGSKSGGDPCEVKNSSAASLRPLREPCSPTSPVTLLVQALPGFVFMPCLRVCTWILFLWVLVNLRAYVYTGHDFFLSTLIMVLAGVIANILRQLVVPWLGILLKWVVIGRYRASTHATFSWYYLRWWFVDQMLSLGGRGCFTWHKYAGLPSSTS